MSLLTEPSMFNVRASLTPPAPGVLATHVLRAAASCSGCSKRSGTTSLHVAIIPEPQFA
jgi:hypothetical protein